MEMTNIINHLNMKKATVTIRPFVENVKAGTIINVELVKWYASSYNFSCRHKILNYFGREYKIV
jgi:hypothetical protein